MLLIQKKALDDETILINEFVDFDSNWLERAKKEFEVCKQEGIILNSDFNDRKWLLTNQRRVTAFIFEFPQILYREQISRNNREMIMSFDEFVGAIKAYIIFQIHSRGLKEIGFFLSFLKKIVNNTDYFNPKNVNKWFSGYDSESRGFLSCVYQLLQLFNFLPIPDIEVLKQQVQDDYAMMNQKSNVTKSEEPINRRSLAEFQSYFYFDKLLKQFWHIATDCEKLYYYPLYLWWKITNILPIRPTEFLLTPYDCLNPNDKGEYKLKIRRSKLKGLRKKYVSQKIDDDYVPFEFPISNEVVLLIKDYKERTKEFGESKFLMNYEAYLSFLPLNIRKSLKSKTEILKAPFSASTLENILLKFYADIFQKKFNLEILSKKSEATTVKKTNDLVEESEEKFLDSTKIMKVNLGDTRHFALINMALSDVNPILIKDFTNHSDINVSFHYFGHIHKIVKCLSYNKFKALRETVIDTGQLNTLRPITQETIQLKIDRDSTKYKEVDMGKCFSPKFYIGDITDCIKAENGECFNCKHIELNEEKHKEALENRKIELEKRIREDGNYFFYLMTNYKGALNEEAELNRALLKLQQSSSEYLSLE